MLHTYDPKQVSVVVGGATLSGYADDTFVEVARDEDMWALNIGADGEGARSKSNNRSGTVTITLQQTSEGNRILSDLAVADELTNSGVFPCLVKDSSGASIHVAEQAWVQKMPDSAYARESGTREWVIRTDSLSTFVGGN